MGYESSRVFDDAWDSIDIYHGPEVFLRTLAGVDRDAALLYAAHFAQSEICNGGFAQFFSNSTGVLCPEAVSGLKAIGMPGTSALVQEVALQLFGEPYPRARKERKEKLENIERKILDALNSKFFVLIGSEGGGFEAASNAFILAR